MDQVLHLLVLYHNEVLNLLREPFKSIDEVRGFVSRLDLLKVEHGLLLAYPRDDTVLELRVAREHPISLLSSSICSRSGIGGPSCVTRGREASLLGLSGVVVFEGGEGHLATVARDDTVLVEAQRALLALHEFGGLAEDKGGLGRQAGTVFLFRRPMRLVQWVRVVVPMVV